MQSFLNKITQEILSKHASELDKVNIILPSRRASVFLNNEFQKLIKKASWLPQIYSLEDFIISLENYSILDSVDLIFELYHVHRELEGQKAESFEDFMGWGGILLQDFNEIDRYLIDPKRLYNYLAEVKEIESWDVSSNKITAFQKKYLQFWKSLGKYYLRFTERLLQENKAYQGLAFRKIAERISKKELKVDSDKHFYFAGFNALTKAEQKIINEFALQKNAQVLWDIDAYYLEDVHQEAGFFLRKHQAKQGQLNWVFDNLQNEEKEINIYGISGNVAQAKLIGNLLEDKIKEKKGEIKNTAIILADENLLVPTLESIPQAVQKMNVTMGYPLMNSIFYHFFKSIAALHYKKNKSKTKNSFYFKDLIDLLNQLALQLLGKEVIQKVKSIEKDIKDNRLIYVPAELLKKLENSIGISFINLKEDSPSALIKVMQDFCEKIKAVDNLNNNLTEIEKEFLFEFYKVFNRISELNKKQTNLLTFKSLLQLFEQILSVESIDFVGEPLEGLQLMGVLESRTLDFEHVILSSLNEGILPLGKTQNSFIPYDIKREFGLPSYREKDAIFAYHFYRLIQRAKKVDLIYNSRIDPVNGGERSRFIEQIINELPKVNPRIKIKEHTISLRVPIQKTEKFSIKKTEEHLEVIKTHLARGISPSAINSFIQCPLNYYYRYILKMKEEDLIEEQIASHSFGTVVHDTLEKLYQPYIKQLLDLKAIVEIKKNLNSSLLESYYKTLNIEPHKGFHKLAFEVAKKMIVDFISSDEEKIKAGDEIHLINLEYKISAELKDELSLPVKITGFIDRIERHNKVLKIIDYKTGRATNKNVNYKKQENIIREDFSMARQLLLYQFAYEIEKGQKAEAGIISLTNRSEGFIKIENQEKVKEHALYLLKEVIAQMLDLEEDFKHNPDSLYCPFC